MSVIEKISVQGTDYDIKDTAITKKMEGLLAPSLDLSDLEMGKKYIIRLIFPNNSNEFYGNFCKISWSGELFPDIDLTNLDHYHEAYFTPETSTVRMETNAVYYHIAEAKAIIHEDSVHDAGEIFCLHSLMDQKYIEGTIYANQFATYEQERELDYGKWTEFHNRFYNGEILDIESITLSCILHNAEGQVCYATHDLTRMAQAVEEGKSAAYALTGVFNSIEIGPPELYSFKITIRRSMDSYEIYPERFRIGEKRDDWGAPISITNIKARTIFTRYIKEI